MTNAHQIKAAVAAAHARFGRLDVIVNNAGYGLFGALEEVTEQEVRRLFDVNVFGPLQVMQAALPFLRGQRRGHLINISSIASLAPIAGSAIYAAARVRSMDSRKAWRMKLRHWASRLLW